MTVDGFAHPFMYWVGMDTDPRTTPEALAEFNRFYSATHVHEVMAAHAGFVSVSRYELLDPDPRGGVHAGPQAGSDGRGGEQRAAGDAAAHGLGQRHHVGRDAEMLIGEPVARPAAARLHFVENEQQPALVAQSAQARQKALGRNPNAPFALHRFDHDGGRLFVDRSGLDIHHVRQVLVVNALLRDGRICGI